MNVRTRFAPSPTGYMHIGGMRTALFNWLWARQHGGKFILRIDDTDHQRNMDEALRPILDAFRWLGLDWDEGPEVGGDHGPYYQSERRSLHDAAVKQLLDNGSAYNDFETPEETSRQRNQAEAEKRTFVSSRESLTLTESEVADKLAAGQTHVVRFKIPRGQTVSVEDRVRGHVEWDCNLMPDPVIARGDGSPLYNFATVVDDAQLEITHVIRAEEHLSNTAIQILLYQALGHPLPEFAHLPFVAAPGGKKKLSKRHIAEYRKSPAFQKLFQLGDSVLAGLGHDPEDLSLSPVMVAYYREVGFLPEGLLNALARIGWSLDDQTENMSLQTIVDHFSLDRVVKGAAAFDPDKLMSFQTHWMSQLSDADKLNGCIAFLERAGLLEDGTKEQSRDRVRQVMELAGDRIRVFGDVLDMSEFFVSADALTFETNAFRKRIIEASDSTAILRQLAGILKDCPEFRSEALHDLVSAAVNEMGLKFGQVAPVLRLAVTGKSKGADLFPTLELVGRNECLLRIERVIELADASRKSG
jgi:glutamyl-tRNA synthetase